MQLNFEARAGTEAEPAFVGIYQEAKKAVSGPLRDRCAKALHDTDEYKQFSTVARELAKLEEELAPIERQIADLDAERNAILQTPAAGMRSRLVELQKVSSELSAQRDALKLLIGHFENPPQNGQPEPPARSVILGVQPLEPKKTQTQSPNRNGTTTQQAKRAAEEKLEEIRQKVASEIRREREERRKAILAEIGPKLSAKLTELYRLDQEVHVLANDEQIREELRHQLLDQREDTPAGQP
jgi:hypothetical protein